MGIFRLDTTAQEARVFRVHCFYHLSTFLNQIDKTQRSHRDSVVVFAMRPDVSGLRFLGFHEMEELCGSVGHMMTFFREAESFMSISEVQWYYMDAGPNGQAMAAAQLERTQTIREALRKTAG